MQINEKFILNPNWGWITFHCFMDVQTYLITIFGGFFLKINTFVNSFFNLAYSKFNIQDKLTNYETIIMVYRFMA